MNALPAGIVELVWQRAGSRCEYCRLHQDQSDHTFHIDHVAAKQHGGSDEPDNLCLSCSQCNRKKGPNLSGLVNGKVHPLFNPRKQNWTRHFEWAQTTLVAKTAAGLATILVLDINSEERVRLREQLLFEGRFPPEESDE